MISNEFAWEEIKTGWLAGGKLALSADQVVAAFNVVSGYFGREWVEENRTHNGAVARGTVPTIEIVALGQFLLALGDAPDTENLIAKVCARDSGAWAELAAIYLLRKKRSSVELLVEPEVVVGRHNRRPDCAMRIPGEQWTYIEVTQPKVSSAQQEVREALQRLGSLVDQRSGSFSLEIFFDREPVNDELDMVIGHVLSHQCTGDAEAIELEPDLGTAYWSQDVSSNVTLDNHGRPYRPGLGMATVRNETGETRLIAVRWPFTDMRAKSFIHDEARQLPNESPGLIMINISSGAVGAMQSWRALIDRCFNPNAHTRVSAVILFCGGHTLTSDGAIWRPEVVLIKNPHARHPLPTWIS